MQEDWIIPGGNVQCYKHSVKQCGSCKTKYTATMQSHS